MRSCVANKVVVDFIGGGACWDAFTCGIADAIFEDSIDSVRDRVENGVPTGFYDHDYTAESNGVKLTDWLKDRISGTSIPSVKCQAAECDGETP